MDITLNLESGGSWKRVKILEMLLFFLRPSRVEWKGHTLTLEDCDLKLPSEIVGKIEKWEYENYNTFPSVSVVSVSLSEKEKKALISLKLLNKLEKKKVESNEEACQG